MTPQVCANCVEQRHGECMIIKTPAAIALQHHCRGAWREGKIKHHCPCGCEAGLIIPSRLADSRHGPMF